MNYRSVVVLGTATRVDRRGREGDGARGVHREAPSRPLGRSAAPDREGAQGDLGPPPAARRGVGQDPRPADPSDGDTPDAELDVWAGHLPLVVQALAPVPDPALRSGIPVPPALARRIGARASCRDDAARFDTVVMKFGGSSVADPEKIRHVARRLVDARRRGLQRGRDGLGDGQDDGHAARPRRATSRPRRTRASSTCSSRRASGSRARSSRWRSTTSARRRSPTPARRPGSSRTRRTHGRRSARSAATGSGRRSSEGQDRARRRLPGVLARHDGDHDARSRRHGRDRRRARRRARRAPARSTRTSAASSPPTRGSCPSARKLAVVSYDEMLEMAASGAKVLDAALGRARPQPRRAHPRALDVLGRGGNLGAGRQGWSSRSSRRSPTRETDVVFTLTGIPDRPGVAALIFDGVASAQVNVDTIIQNVVHGNAEMSFSVPAEDVPATRGAIARTQAELGAFDGRGEPRARQGLADRGRHALAPGRRGDDVPDARRARDQPRDDLDLADQDLVHDRPRPDPGGRARAPRRVRAGARARGEPTI